MAYYMPSDAIMLKIALFLLATSVLLVTVNVMLYRDLMAGVPAVPRDYASMGIVSIESPTGVYSKLLNAGPATLITRNGSALSPIPGGLHTVSQGYAGSLVTNLGYYASQPMLLYSTVNATTEDVRPGIPGAASISASIGPIPGPGPIPIIPGPTPLPTPTPSPSPSSSLLYWFNYTLNMTPYPSSLPGYGSAVMVDTIAMTSPVMQSASIQRVPYTVYLVGFISIYHSEKGPVYFNGYTASLVELARSGDSDTVTLGLGTYAGLLNATVSVAGDGLLVEARLYSTSNTYLAQACLGLAYIIKPVYPYTLVIQNITNVGSARAFDGNMDWGNYTVYIPGPPDEYLIYTRMFTDTGALSTPYEAYDGVATVYSGYCVVSHNQTLVGVFSLEPLMLHFEGGGGETMQIARAMASMPP